MKNNEPELKSIRDGFGEGFMEAGEKNSQVLGLSADLTESVRMQEFAERYSRRFFQVGIAEQNMAGIAAGLALSGFIPYTGSFACFQPYRNLDHIRTSICIQNANVKIVSSHSGFSYAADGIQVQALEDIGIMAALPNMQVWVPADAQQAREMAIAAAEIDGPVYIRLGREKTVLLATVAGIEHEQLKFIPGKAQLLRAGTDVTLIATGYMTYQAIKAAHLLAEEGYHATVINVPSIKPLDTEMILEAAGVTKKVLVLEEHQISSGLGALVATELLKAGLAVKFDQVGVADKFGDTAQTTEELWKYYGLDIDTILQKVHNLL